MFKLFSSRPKEDGAQPTKESIKLILGLGNPGEKYASTYHNIGQLYVEGIANGSFKKYRHFEFSKKSGVIFAKPTTFMNQSGIAAKEALKYFNLKPENLLVVHDDSDILLGEYKITFDRGSAGHNGVQSVIDILKTEKFFRLRIGMRQDGITTKAGEFVLRPISKSDLSTLRGVFLDINIR